MKQKTENQQSKLTKPKAGQQRKNKERESKLSISEINEVPPLLIHGH